MYLCTLVGRVISMESLVFIGLSASFLIVLTAYQAGFGKSLDRNYSMTGYNMVPSNFANMEEGTFCLRPGFSPEQCLLRRPGENKFVALLLIYRDGSVRLNPRGASYGPVPDLKNMTIMQADTLWSSPGHSNTHRKNRFSYKLLLGNRPCYIDCCFSGDKLQRYRVRADDEQSIVASWHKT